LKNLTFALWVVILTTKIVNKSTQISKLFTFQISEAAAWCSTAMGMKNTGTQPWVGKHPIYSNFL
jgi:hypothetical protein